METQLEIEVFARRSRWSLEKIGQDFATLVRLGFAVLFAVTGIAKLASGEAFVDALRGYELVPIAAIDLVAGAVIVSELALAVWLASGCARRAALCTVAASLLTLAGVIAIAAWTGATGDCGCFSGVAESSIGLGAVVRNAALTAIAINAAVIERPRSAMTVRDKEKERC